MGGANDNRVPRTANAEFHALQALVAELRGRLPPTMTERQYQDVGVWLLKACWLGRGEPLGEVFG